MNFNHCWNSLLLGYSALDLFAQPIRREMDFNRFSGTVLPAGLPQYQVRFAQPQPVENDKSTEVTRISGTCCLRIEYREGEGGVSNKKRFKRTLYISFGDVVIKRRLVNVEEKTGCRHW